MHFSSQIPETTTGIITYKMRRRLYDEGPMTCTSLGDGVGLAWGQLFLKRNSVGSKTRPACLGPQMMLLPFSESFKIVRINSRKFGFGKLDCFSFEGSRIRSLLAFAFCWWLFWFPILIRILAFVIINSCLSSLSSVHFRNLIKKLVFSSSVGF